MSAQHALLCARETLCSAAVSQYSFFSLCSCLTICFTVYIRWWWRKRGPDVHVAVMQRSCAVTPSLSTTRMQHHSTLSTTSQQNSPLGASRPLCLSLWGTTEPTVASGMHHCFHTRAIVSTTKPSVQLMGWVLIGWLNKTQASCDTIQPYFLFLAMQN